jgi:outer membrane protein assembly factor BamD (BamD/ComL family)
LQRAERALRDGKPEQALSVLSEHARQFPKGELRAERTAARIAALCALNRKAEARRDAAAFLKQWPGSPLAAQVRASCAAPDDKVTMP